MPELTSQHLDDFTLLRYTAGDLVAEERQAAADHLKHCSPCSRSFEEVAELDTELNIVAREPGCLSFESDDASLPERDPFRIRPAPAPPPQPRDAAIRAFPRVASGATESLRDEILEAAKEARDLEDRLASLSLGVPEHRFALLYALQDAGGQIAESPVRMLRLAEGVLRCTRIRDADANDESQGLAESLIPRTYLTAYAHMLAATACNWTAEFEKGRAHLEVAYRAFARCGGDDLSFAMVEYLEAQRRSFIRKEAEALVLARRAAATFREFELEDWLARARGVMGLALTNLERFEEAETAFRASAPVFERMKLWRNYTNCLNNLAVCLQRVGRLDDARREYARALRRISRDQHRSLAFVRHGLAEVLFLAGRYREAAMSLSQAARRYSDLGLVARSLTASLFEIENWARSGDLQRARRRLEIFQAEVVRHRALDPSVVREIQDALSGENPDFERLSGLRRDAQESLQEALRETSA
jgi:tetratricopeptide (TPR) repeat protein